MYRLPEPKFYEKDNLQVNANLYVNSTTNLDLSYGSPFCSLKKTCAFGASAYRDARTKLKSKFSIQVKSFTSDLFISDNKEFKHLTCSCLCCIQIEYDVFFGTSRFSGYDF